VKKMAGKQNGRWAIDYYRTLGWSTDSKGSVENPLRVLGISEGCFLTLKEYFEKILAGSA
jgi:hypothetical protein